MFVIVNLPLLKISKFMFKFLTLGFSNDNSDSALDAIELKVPDGSRLFYTVSMFRRDPSTNDYSCISYTHVPKMDVPF